MTTATDSSLIVGTLYLVAIIVLMYGPWQSIATDWARQKLFEGRDKIFDMATNGEIDRNSLLYRELRRSLNAMIRFTEDVTWPQLLLAAVALPAARDANAAPWRELAEQVPPATREEINRVMYKAGVACSLLLWARSPVLLALTALLLPLLALAVFCAWLTQGPDLRRRAKNGIGQFSQRLQAEALMNC